MPLSQIKEKIKENSKLSEEEVNQKIQDKLEQLSGLISEEGAAHIIANELGIKLFEVGGLLQVKNILSGMRNVEITGKVIRKYELREFKTETKEGKIASFLVADETGIIRVVLWNEQTDDFEKINENDILKIKGAFARDNNGRKELHLSTGGVIEINPKGVKVETADNTRTRKELKDLAEGDENIEVLATIVQVFDPRFFEVCPECGKRTKPVDGTYNCPEHGDIKPDYSYVLNLFLDDGTDNVRAVLWKNQTLRLFEKTHEEFVKFRTSPTEFEPLKTEMLGTIVKVVGRTNKNDAFDRIELIANMIFKDIKPEEEINRLKKQAETTKEEPQRTEVKEKVSSTPKEETKTRVEEKKQKIESIVETKEEVQETNEHNIEEIEDAVNEDSKEDFFEKDDVLSIDDLEDIKE